MSVFAHGVKIEVAYHQINHYFPNLERNLQGRKVILNYLYLLDQKRPKSQP